VKSVDLPMTPISLSSKISVAVGRDYADVSPLNEIRLAASPVAHACMEDLAETALIPFGF
jgi:hypothetical protein